MSTHLSDLLRHIAARAASQEVTVREVLDGCETTATPADLLRLLDTERRRQGLKKFEVANLCGVSASTFSRLTSANSSDKLTIEGLLMIAVALGLLDPGALPPVSGQASRRKVKRRGKKRARSARPSSARMNGRRPTDPREEQSRPADDYATIGLREAAVILGLHFSSLVELAEKRLLPGTVWEDDAWRIGPLALAKLVEAKNTGPQTQEVVSELNRRIEAVEEANEKLKGEIKLIESVRELVLQSRQGGASAPDSRSTVLEYLPGLLPNLFKSKEPITMGDFLRVFPDASDFSVDFLASVLMFPVPSKDLLKRFRDDWLRLYENIRARAEKRDSEKASSEKATSEQP